MIATTHATLKMLRAGRLEVVTVPMRQPRPGATAAKCHVSADREYLLVAKETDDHKRETLTAVALAVEEQDGAWRVTFRAGVGIEAVRFLKARPGGEDGDYTMVASKAASDEPEPVDQGTLARFEKDARTAEQVRLGWERQSALQDVDAAIVRLEAQGFEADRVALQKLRAARRELLKAA